MFKEVSRMLGTSSRTKLLKFYIFQPTVRVTAAVAGSAVGVPKAIAEREARALARLGILTARSLKKKTLFTLNQKHTLVPQMRAFLDEATMPDDRAILSAFRGITGVSLIVATGVLAREERSAVDVLVVAKKSKNAKIAKAVSKIERLAAMPLRFVVMEPEIYAERKEAHDRLIRDVFEFKNRLILGRAG